ncbi:MAG: hypothetical protein R2827_15980 [Bdellovibrionales bacterium]
MKYKLIIPLLGTFILIGLFQNCTNVRLVKPEEIVILQSSLSGDICLDEDFSGYTIDSMNIINRNYRLIQGEFWFDADADGLPDALEEELGFNPKAQRTNGQVIDGLCYRLAGNSSCEDFINECALEADVFGFNACDYQLFNANGGDTDLDDVADSLELIIGTIADENDRLLDPDADGINNLQEIARGSDPTFADQMISTNDFPKIGLELQPSTGDCQGENWKVLLNEPLLFEGPAYVDPQQPNSHAFNREPTENIITIWLVLKPRQSTNGETHLFGYTVKLRDNEPIHLGFSDFEEVASW